MIASTKLGIQINKVTKLCNIVLYIYIYIYTYISTYILWLFGLYEPSAFINIINSCRYRSMACNAYE